MKLKMNPITWKLAGLVVVLGLGAGAAYALQSSVLKTSNASTSASSSASKGSQKLAATVDGQSIFESELAPIVAQGVDPALAVDRYINKVIAANLAKANYPSDSGEAMKGAEREVLSQLFVAKRTEELRAAVKDADIKAYYDSNVKAEDFADYKVSAVIISDQKEAETMAEAIASGHGKDYDARFKAVTDTSAGYAHASEFPYGLGGVVKSLKKGEYTRPLSLRSGYTVLRLDDVRVNPRPELAKVSDAIKNVLVSRILSDQLVAARKSARVELH
jgi:peptidyl-prolyl cis-trans isomerase C